MVGYDSAEGYRLEPLDNRDEENPEYTIEPILSSPDFNFSEEDPAMIREKSGDPAELATFDPRSEA